MQTLAGWLEGEEPYKRSFLLASKYFLGFYHDPDTAEWIAHMWKLTGTEAVVAELLKLISRPWAMVLFWVASVANQTWMIFVGVSDTYKWDLYFTFMHE